MSIASATADVRAALAALETAYFALQRQIAASVGSACYPEVQAACDVVREVYQVGPLEIVGRKRDAGVCWARHVAIWLVHGVGRMSLAQVGEARRSSFRARRGPGHDARKRPALGCEIGGGNTWNVCGDGGDRALANVHAQVGRSTRAAHGRLHPAW